MALESWHDPAIMPVVTRVALTWETSAPGLTGDRGVEPRAMHAGAADVPEVRDGGAIARVLHGNYGGRTPAYRMVTPVTLLHVRLLPHATLTLPAQAMALAYGLSGSAVSMFGTGTPLGEPIVYGGPFVMTTAAGRPQCLRPARAV